MNSCVLHRSTGKISLVLMLPLAASLTRRMGVLAGKMGEGVVHCLCMLWKNS